jgi:hypothetical protein
MQLLTRGGIGGGGAGGGSDGGQQVEGPTGTLNAKLSERVHQTLFGIVATARTADGNSPAPQIVGSSRHSGSNRRSTIGRGSTGVQHMYENDSDLSNTGSGPGMRSSQLLAQTAGLPRTATILLPGIGVDGTRSTTTRRLFRFDRKKRDRRNREGRSGKKEREGLEQEEEEDEDESESADQLATQIIQLDEFQRLLRLLQLDVSTEVALQRFCAADRYGFGVLDFVEYRLALRAIVAMLTDEVMRSIGLSKIDQTILFLGQIIVLFSIFAFLFFGVQGFHDGTVPVVMLIASTMALVASVLVSIVESSYFEPRRKRLGPGNIMKQIDLAERTMLRKQ